MENGAAVRQQQAAGSETYGGIGHYLAARIAEVTGSETRVTVLGHLQRGGMPTDRDRLMATIFGMRAVDLIAEGRFDRMVAWSGRTVIDIPIAEAIAGYKAVDLRSEEHTSELQSLMRISYAVFCLKKKKHTTINKLKTR